MLNIMWTTIKSIRNSFFVLIFLILSFPTLDAKNSKDVSNTEVKKKNHISQKKILSEFS